VEGKWGVRAHQTQEMKGKEGSGDPEGREAKSGLASSGRGLDTSGEKGFFADAGGTSADPLDELQGRITTRSSRLFFQGGGLILGDGNNGDAGEIGGESTMRGVGVFPSGKPLSQNWFG